LSENSRKANCHISLKNALFLVIAIARNPTEIEQKPWEYTKRHTLPASGSTEVFYEVVESSGFVQRACLKTPFQKVFFSKSDFAGDFLALFAKFVICLNMG